jgi:hypothetical protein
MPLAPLWVSLASSLDAVVICEAGAQHGLHLLNSLVIRPEGRVEVVHTVPFALALVTTHLASLEVARMGVSCLMWLSRSDASLVELKTYATSTVPTLGAAMGAHPDDAEIQAWGVEVVGRLA